MEAFFPPGMAHRDLKPENILCENSDKVSLLQACSVRRAHWGANVCLGSDTANILYILLTLIT